MSNPRISPYEIRKRLNRIFRKCGVKCAPMPLPEMGRAEFVARFRRVSSKDFEPVNVMVIMTYHLWDRVCTLHAFLPKSASFEGETEIEFDRLLERLKEEVEASFDDVR